MKNLFYNLLIVSTYLCLDHSIALAGASDLLLQKGEHRTITNSQNIKNVWIENSNVIKAQKIKGKIILKAVGIGFSRLRLDQSYFNVSVTDVDVPESFKQAQMMLKEIPGIQLNWSTYGPRVDGTLISLQDWHEIGKTFQRLNLEYLMSAEIAPYLRELVQLEIQKQFEQIGLPYFKIQFSDKPFLRIHQKQPFSSEIKKTARFWGIEVIENNETLEDSPQIRVNLILAEVKKSDVLKYGTDLSANIPFKKNIADSSEFVRNIHALQIKGDAKVLASPSLFCRSGKEAEFFAGGEFPIKIFNSTTHDVIWKKYGVILNFKPLADFTGRMSLQISTEVSTLDKANTVDGIPAITTNRVSTHFDLRRNQTIMLSGLIKSHEGLSQQGLPGLQNLPILGPLFSSRDWFEERSELVVLVTPEFVIENL